MARLFTLDASVLLNAFNRDEAGSPDSRRLLEDLRDRAAPLIEPTLLLSELAAAIRRGTQDPDLARQVTSAVAELPNLVMVSLDDPLAREAAGLAADYSLRGADAVYGAVALRFGAELVSLDQEQISRLSDVLLTRSPSAVTFKDS